MIERWKAIPKAPAYEVSNLGRVRRGGRVLKPALRGDVGYRKVTLWTDGAPMTKYIHRLVAEAFVPKPDPRDDTVRHSQAPIRGGGDAAANLAWGSMHDNVMDKVRDGTINRGEDHGRAKLTEDDVRAIRAAYDAGAINFAHLAQHYGVTYVAIGQAAKRRTWKHVT